MKISTIAGEGAWLTPLVLPSIPIFSWLARKRQRSAAIPSLRGLDPRLLADIGLERHRISDSLEVYSRLER